MAAAFVEEAWKAHLVAAIAGTEAAAKKPAATAAADVSSNFRSGRSRRCDVCTKD
jgi:hypothetical protein